MSDLATTPKPLPPGSTGLPLLGETLSFIKNPYAFMENRRRDYGTVFKSSLLGHKVAFVSGPEAATAFLDTENVTREKAHPSHVRELFGGINMNMFDGPKHLALKTLALEGFNRAAIESYVPDLQRMIEAAFAKWVSTGEVRAVEELRRLAIELICTNVMGLAPGPETDALRNDYIAVTAGFISLPLPLPGTTFSKAKKARDRILAIFRKTIVEHRQKPTNDGLSRILAAKMPDGRTFTDDEALLELHHIVIAGYIVFALLAELLLRLDQQPELRARLTEEVRAASPEGPITSRALVSLAEGSRVILEAKRTAPIVPLVFGKARRAFQIGDFTIPEGWDVFWALSLSNNDPAVFASPTLFEPARFAPGRAEQDKHKYAWVPQGGEPPTSHRCLGLEYSSFIALTFLVVLLRDHNWKIPEQNLSYVWERTPPEPVDGLRIAFSRT